MNRGEVAVVVGASGALGGAIAERLRAEGLTVVGVTRGAIRPPATPNVATPGVSRPGAATPGVGGPGVAAPGAGAAGVGTPSVSRPGVASPGVSRPGVATPGAGAPGVGRPDDGGPGVAAPGGGGQDVGGPEQPRQPGWGGGLEQCATDIGTDDAIPAIAAAVGGRPVRMVVQAAGLQASGPLATIEPDALGRAVALKCGGLLRLVRSVDANLQPGARIVALGGHYGIEPAPNACAAGVTNAALANLVRQLAIAYGPRAVTAHLVAPGPADTPRMRALSQQAAATRGVPVDEVLAERAAESPLGRLVTPVEVAWAVATLLAPEAGALDGSALSLDVGARRGIF